jgi:hypothetical protein
MHVLSYVRVCEQHTDDALGHLVDISTQGMRVASPRALAPHTTIELSLDLPVAEDKVRQLSFEAQVIWSRPSLEFDCWDSGLQLVGVNQYEIEQIERFIQTAADQDRWLSIGSPLAHEH